MVETYQKIDPATGRGVLVIFANRVGTPYGPDRPMTAEAVTDSTVAHSVVTTAGVAVRFNTAGRAIVRAQFEETGSAIVFFGAAAVSTLTTTARGNLSQQRLAAAFKRR